MTETWRAVPGFPGYEASTLGRVQSYHARGGSRGWFIADTQQRILKPGNSGYYPYVRLMSDGRKVTLKVHTVVARTFLGPRPEHMEICHANDDPHDNRVQNLRYDTRKANHYEGLLNRGLGYSITQVEDMRQRRADGETITSIAAGHGCSHAVVSRICRGVTYTHMPGPHTNRRWFKLDDGQVDKLRCKLASNGTSQGALAAEFGVSNSMVSMIKTGRRRC